MNDKKANELEISSLASYYESKENIIGEEELKK